MRARLAGNCRTGSRLSARDASKGNFCSWVFAKDEGAVVLRGACHLKILTAFCAICAGVFDRVGFKITNSAEACGCLAGHHERTGTHGYDARICSAPAKRPRQRKSKNANRSHFHFHFPINDPAGLASPQLNILTMICAQIKVISIHGPAFAPWLWRRLPQVRAHTGVRVSQRGGCRGIFCRAGSGALVAVICKICDLGASRAERRN